MGGVRSFGFTIFPLVYRPTPISVVATLKIHVGMGLRMGISSPM